MKTSRCYLNCTSAIRGILITASFLSRSSSRHCSGCTHRFLQIDQLLCTSLKSNYSSCVVRSKLRLLTSSFHCNSFYTSFSRSCNTVPVSISYNAVHPRACTKRTIQKQLTNGVPRCAHQAYYFEMHLAVVWRAASCNPVTFTAIQTLCVPTTFDGVVFPSACIIKMSISRLNGCSIISRGLGAGLRGVRV